MRLESVAAGTSVLSALFIASILVIPSPATAVSGKAAESEIFTLTATGTDASCLLHKPTSREQGSADADGAVMQQPIVLEPSCDAVLPALSGVRMWIEGEDGTVALASGDGSTIARFAVGDGTAYESFQPRSPLMSLDIDR